MVLLVPLQVLGQAIDPVCQQCDLHIRRTSVLLMHPEILDYFGFSSVLCTHLSYFRCERLGGCSPPVKEFSELFGTGKGDTPPKSLFFAAEGRNRSHAGRLIRRSIDYRFFWERQIHRKATCAHYAIIVQGCREGILSNSVCWGLLVSG